MNSKQAEAILRRTEPVAEAIDTLESDLEDITKALSSMPLDPTQARRLRRSVMYLTRTAAQLACSLNSSANSEEL